MPKTVLYYPSINICDGLWLRNAVLYWDRVSSIVPDQYNAHFSPEIDYLRKEGLYYPIYPSRLFFSRDDYNDFEKEMLRKLRSRVATKKRADKFPNINQSQINWPELNMLIHYRKISSKLYDYMFENELISRPDDIWLSMEKETLILYMSTLAEYLAKTNDVPTIIGTDRNEFLGKAFSRTLPNENNLCVSVCLQNALPAPNPDVSFKKIVRFKIKRIQELLQLRQKIGEFETTIVNCENMLEIRDKVSNFRDKWTLALHEYHALLKDEKIEYTFGTMKSLCATSVPGIATAIGTAFGAIPAWATIASLSTGGVIGVGYGYSQYRKALRKLRDDSGFAYLYDAEKKGLIRTGRYTINIDD